MWTSSMTANNITWNTTSTYDKVIVSYNVKKSK